MLSNVDEDEKIKLAIMPHITPFLSDNSKKKHSRVRTKQVSHWATIVKVENSDMLEKIDKINEIYSSQI